MSVAVGWLLLAICALLLHEYVLLSGRFRRLPITAVRYPLLGLTLGSVVMAAPGLVTTLKTFVPERRPTLAPFTPNGDVFLTRALSRQQPQWPYPASPTPA